MPTSVLLAILAGAGLLALAPALVRRYDADERIAAERENSRARVLDRESGKGRTGPLNPPSDAGESAAEPGESTLDELLTQDSGDGESALRAETPTAEADSSRPRRRRAWERRGARRAESVGLSSDRQEAKGRFDEQEVSVASALRAWWQRRYRRVLYVLLALNLVELLGVIFLGPGFWIGAGVSMGLLLLFLRFLRVRARRQQRRRPTARVPRQVSAAPEEELADDGEYEAEDDEAAEETAQPVAEAPSRRRTGGIRGRSYESPANL